jgi:hypothetical protein
MSYPGSSGHGVKLFLTSLGVWSGTALAQTACAPPATGPQLCLTGTILSPGGNVAMLEQAGHTGVSGLRLGDSILDWQVVEIASKYVKLGKAGETVTISVADPNQTPAVATPPTPVPPVLRRRGG